MISEVWVLFAITVLVFIALTALLHSWHSQKFKAAQRLLRRSKQETQELAQLPLSNPHPLIQISKDGDIIFANPVTFEKFPEIKTQGIKHPLLTGLADIANPNETVMREVRIDRVFYHQTITPARANNQNAYIIYCYDITERKQYEEDLKRSHQRAENSRAAAEKANQARGDFLANMSHELRTPMNGIIGLSDILIEADIKEQHKEAIEAINSSSRNLLILLNDILDFSKIEAGELTIESIAFDMRHIVRQIEKLQKPLALQKNVRLKTIIDKDLPPRLIGDPSRLQQILNNLISNALKFTAQGSVTLRIDGKQDNKGYFFTRIAVIDTGVGIPENAQRKIFSKFQQADASTTRKYGGTGLGLAITKDLAELMGGDIFLQSEEGQGSTFIVTIPMQIAEAGSYAENKPPEDPTTPACTINTRAKIMVVDDHPVNLLFMRQALQKLGFRNFDEASSGEEALALFVKNNPYNLILLDCHMPEMDGFEAARKIREIETAENEPAIIAVTADAMKGAEEKCMAAGMDDYISKPVDQERLKSLLLRWIPGDENQVLQDAQAAKDLYQHKSDTPSRSADANPDIFNWSRLYEFSGGDRDTENQLLDIFIENLEKDIKDLEHNFKSDNYEGWDEMAHKLYGACSHVGASALAKVCDQAQSISADELWKMKDLHPIILSEYKRVQDVLKKVRNIASTQ